MVRPVRPIQSSAGVLKFQIIELLSNPTQVTLACNYELPGELGNLQMQLVPGLRADGKELLQLSLTAFGKPKTSDVRHLMEWMDNGRFAVVQGFSDFTSTKCKLMYGDAYGLSNSSAIY